MELQINNEPGANDSTHTLLKVLIVIVSILFITGIIFYALAMKTLRQNSNVVSKAPATQTFQTSKNDQALAVAQPVPANVDCSGDVIKKGCIEWQEPEDVGNLGLTVKAGYEGGDINLKDASAYSNGIKYAKVGKIISGKYQGAEIYDALSWIAEGPQSGPDLFRILKYNDEYIFVLKNIRNGTDEYLMGFLKNFFFSGNSKKSLNSDILFEELYYPGEIQGRSEREKFSFNLYDVAFFTNAKLKPAFIHTELGQIWTTDEVKALNENPTSFELNKYYRLSDKKESVYYDIFGRHGFYIKGPDGIAVSYKLVPDIVAKSEDTRFGILNITWNDGKKNTSSYELNPSGCGSGDYVYNKTLKVSIENDLIVVGKTDQGDNIYGYKYTTSPEFQNLYDTIYYPGEEKGKLSMNEFLKTNPEVFWVDPFGRTLAFFREDIISPAECGKPVIYLYPQNSTEVSVKVEPGKGISYSEPKYQDGWNVMADSKSNLTNLTDGKIYPYLFWEGAGDIPYTTPDRGFTVKASELDSFFNDKLGQLGLIEKEIKDFKEFWIPKMLEEKKPYYFVTFFSKHYFDDLAPLTVEPRPDTVIRVLMDFKGLDNYQNFAPIPLSAPVRKGFTVVEWGGMLK